MPRVVELLLRTVGFSRGTPQTSVGRALRRSNQLLTCIAAIWFALHLFPQVVFAHHLTADGVTVYAREPLPPETASRLAQAANLVARSELAVAGRSERIFICNQPLALWAAGADELPRICVLGARYEQHLHRRCRCRDEHGGSRAPAHNTRTPSSVVAHEITHNLIRNRLGVLRGVMLPAWVAEGYCDYVAQESSFPESEGLRLLASGPHRSIIVVPVFRRIAKLSSM